MAKKFLILTLNDPADKTESMIDFEVSQARTELGILKMTCDQLTLNEILVTSDNFEQQAVELEKKYDGFVLHSSITMTENWMPEAKKVLGAFPLLNSLIRLFFQSSKPISSVGFANLVIAMSLSKNKPTLAVSMDWPVEVSGFYLEKCPSDDYISDRETKWVSTPGAMSLQAVAMSEEKIKSGIQGLIKELVEWA